MLIRTGRKEKGQTSIHHVYIHSTPRVRKILVHVVQSEWVLSGKAGPGAEAGQIPRRVVSGILV